MKKVNTFILPCDEIAANFMNFLNFQDINDFVLENKDRPLEKLKVVKPMPKFNQLMHDLGLFRAHTKSIKVVKEKIAKLDRQLDLGKLISKAIRMSYASNHLDICFT